MKPFLGLLAAAPFMSTLVQAHMQLSNPYPINSPLNPDVSYNVKDYSYTSPLHADGSNYPCKGYHTQAPILYTASYTPGGSYNISIAGSATHLGGSCQISLSYDNGVTFKVIKSMMGGCPLVSTYDFDIPSYAPTGPALLAWTWFNHAGNREIYMNCAWVTISNGAGRRRTRRQTSSFNALPNIFLANIPQAQGVTTVEGFDVTFPDPGTVVQYGGSIDSSTPLGQGYTGTSVANSGSAGSSPDSGSAPSSSPSQAVSSSNPVASSDPAPVFTLIVDSTVAASSTAAATTTPGAVFATLPPYPYSNTSTTQDSPPQTSLDSSPQTTMDSSPQTPLPAVPTQQPQPAAPTTIAAPPPSSPTTVAAPLPAPSIITRCSPGALLCPSPSTYALCNADGTPTTPQPVAPGTQCSNGNIVLASAQGSCDATPGVWLCTHGGMSFSSCWNGQWVNMGSVAAGTVCRDGVIVAS